MTVDIEDVEAVLEKLLRMGGRPVLLQGENIPLDCAAAADGLLPLFVLAGEALWREVEGEGFQITTAPDDGALLGYRVAEIGTGSFTALMLATMEAASQVNRPKGIIVEDLHRIWSASNERFEAGRQTAGSSL